MKMASLCLATFGTLSLMLAACGADMSEPAPSATAQTPITGSQGGASVATSAASDEDRIATDGSGGATDPTAFGKRCYASCSVVSVGTTTCLPNIGGYGYTTFLGGCNKACGKAQGDAAAKLPAGCVINICSFSGC